MPGDGEHANRLWRRLLPLLFALGASFPGLCRAGPEVGSEYQTKAAQIYSFTKFVEWPAKKFPSSESPFIIGVYGSDEITDFLREAFQSRRIKDRPVEIRHLSNKAELVPCHLVFVSRSERDRLGSVLYEMRHENILSVGESDNFLKSGGVINFLSVEGATRFQVNLDAAGRERLKVSSKLLPISYPANGRPPPANAP
jgi:YfiR/HmsC-like